MSRSATTSKRRHLTTALVLGGVFIAMTGAAFAAVPLYKAFCQATGFAGTVRRATSAPTTTSSRKLLVKFDTNVRGIPWTFEPEQRSQTIQLGVPSVAYFKVTNNADHAITGRAAYNVDPELAGWHLRKLQCFCFNAETLQAHQTAEWPVIYFVEPAFATDPNTKDYGDITLSYTFVQVAPETAKAPQAKS